MRQVNIKKPENEVCCLFTFSLMYKSWFPSRQFSQSSKQITAFWSSWITSLPCCVSQGCLWAVISPTSFPGVFSAVGFPSALQTIVLLREQCRWSQFDHRISRAGFLFQVAHPEKPFPASFWPAWQPCLPKNFDLQLIKVGIKFSVRKVNYWICCCFNPDELLKWSE